MNTLLPHDPPVFTDGARAVHRRTFIGASCLLLLPCDVLVSAPTATDDCLEFFVVEGVVLFLQHLREPRLSDDRLVAHAPHDGSLGQDLVRREKYVFPQRRVGAKVESGVSHTVQVLRRGARVRVAGRLDVATQRHVLPTHGGEETQGSNTLCRKHVRCLHMYFVPYSNPFFQNDHTSMRDEVYRAQFTTGRRIPSYVEETFNNEYTTEIFNTATRQLIGQEFDRIYNASWGFKFPLTHIDPKHLWQKLYSISLGLSRGCVLIDDISGLLTLLDNSRERSDTFLQQQLQQEMVLVVTPFAIKRLQWLSSQTTTSLERDDRKQLEALRFFMSLPRRKLLVIHSPMVTSHSGHFITGHYDVVEDRRVLQHYKTASEAVSNADQHSNFTVPTIPYYGSRFPGNMPYMIKEIKERDVKIIGLEKQHGERVKKRVLLGQTKRATTRRGEEWEWVELTSTPTHTNAEFGDCIVILLSALVPGSTCWAKDSGVLHNLSMFSRCVGVPTKKDPLDLYVVDLSTPRDKFYRDKERTDDCALDWLKRMIELFTDHRIYSDEFDVLDSVYEATHRSEDVVATKVVNVNTKNDVRDLLEPVATVPYHVRIHSTATHYVCTVVTTASRSVVPDLFFSVASFLASIGGTRTGRVELNQPGHIHDFVYQVSLLHYLTAHQSTMDPPLSEEDFRDPKHRISMQLLDMVDDNLTRPTPRVSLLREEKIPNEGFDVGEGTYEDDETVYKAWMEALRSVAENRNWKRSVSPEPGSKRQKTAEPMMFTIPPTRTAFMRFETSTNKVIQMLADPNKLDPTVRTKLTTEKSVRLNGKHKTNVNEIYKKTLEVLKELEYLIPVDGQKDKYMVNGN